MTYRQVATLIRYRVVDPDPTTLGLAQVSRNIFGIPSGTLAHLIRTCAFTTEGHPQVALTTKSKKILPCHLLCFGDHAGALRQTPVVLQNQSTCPPNFIHSHHYKSPLPLIMPSVQFPDPALIIQDVRRTENGLRKAAILAHDTATLSRLGRGCPKVLNRLASQIMREPLNRVDLGLQDLCKAVIELGLDQGLTASQTDLVQFTRTAQPSRRLAYSVITLLVTGGLLLFVAARPARVISTARRNQVFPKPCIVELRSRLIPCR